MSFGVYSVGLMNLLPKCETALHDFFNALEHMNLGLDQMPAGRHLEDSGSLQRDMTHC